ncbi:cytochrome c oxidase assembly protein [Pseudomonas sp. EA_35y_Pfl2_R111]|uniref:cytochrome c oxidase assembly protein n=1 Tax=Pseudomonas sp. EA_35y_Pfl2_R111 TaxID=3088689 RepID=UPI0030DABB76
MRVIAILCLLLAMPAAQAHGLLDHSLNLRVPLLLSALFLATAWVLYGFGAQRVRPHGLEALWLHLAMLIAVLAVFGPLDDWAETSTSWHMFQHMLFMLVIAPLWALARPLPQWRAVCGPLLQPLWRSLLRSGRYPVPLAMLHGALIWIWHTPSLYILALENLWWHMLEHASFLFSAWLFWWSCLRAPPRQVPQALLAILLTLMHTGLLGALLTFGTSSFYGPERDVADQQLAGLLMWVPGGLVYLAAAGWITWRWLARSWRHQQGAGAARDSG